MKYILGTIISYFLLYITIYLHEVGHALFYYKYGCKDNPFKVTVKPSLSYSTPAPIDTEKAKMLSKWKYISICYGGILSNLLFAIISSVLAFSIKSNNFYVQLFIFQFLTFNLAEIVSYMVIGNIYLVSDMEGIALNEKRLRLPNMLIGLILTIYYVYIFTIMPTQIFLIVFLYNFLIVIIMSIARVLFTIKYKKSMNKTNM